MVSIGLINQNIICSTDGIYKYSNYTLYHFQMLDWNSVHIWFL